MEGGQGLEGVESYLTSRGLSFFKCVQSEEMPTPCTAQFPNTFTAVEQEQTVL
jgi:hypothetical protein